MGPIGLLAGVYRAHGVEWSHVRSLTQSVRSALTLDSSYRVFVHQRIMEKPPPCSPRRSELARVEAWREIKGRGDSDDRWAILAPHASSEGGGVVTRRRSAIVGKSWRQRSNHNPRPQGTRDSWLSGKPAHSRDLPPHMHSQTCRRVPRPSLGEIMRLFWTQPKSHSVEASKITSTTGVVVLIRACSHG